MVMRLKVDRLPSHDRSWRFFRSLGDEHIKTNVSDKNLREHIGANDNDNVELLHIEKCSDFKNQC